MSAAKRLFAGANMAAGRGAVGQGIRWLAGGIAVGSGEILGGCLGWAREECLGALGRQGRVGASSLTLLVSSRKRNYAKREPWRVLGANCCDSC